MRIAYFSPLRPQPTGIADYSEEILLRLVDHVQIDLFVDGYEPSSPPIRDFFPIYDAEEFPRRHEKRPYDVILYQMGNHVSHFYIYRMAQRYPGVVVLHDTVLHHMLAASLLEKRQDFAAYREAFPEDVGMALLRRRQAGLWSDVDHFLFPGIDRVIESSQALIVHAETTARQLRQRFPQARIHVVPHHIGPDSSPFQGLPPGKVKEHFGLHPDFLVLATFGFVTPTKRFHAALRAYREFLKEHPATHYLIVGPQNPYFDIRPLLRESNLEGLVYATGRVSWETFYGLMDATDICIQLRYPSAGEMSGAILRAMSKGKPVMLSNYEQFSEFPDGCCLKVDLGPAEVPMIVSYLRLLARDEPLRRRIGENAREYVRTHHSMERTIQGYLETLQEVASSCGNRTEQGERAMDDDQLDLEWLDVPALMAAIRRELARQQEEGHLPPYERERYQAVVSDWIMEEIRQGLAERWHAGKLVMPGLGRYHTFDEAPHELTESLKDLNTHWKQTLPPLEVQSRTPVIGKAWAALRRRIHEEVRSYLEPLLWQQNDIHAAMVRSLNVLTTGLYGGSLQRSLQALHQEVVGLRQEMQALREQAQARKGGKRGRGRERPAGQEDTPEEGR